MKKLLAICFILSSSIFVSCQRCGTCVQTTSVSGTGSSGSQARSTFEACGATLRNLKNGGGNTTTSSGPVTYTVTTVCN